MRPRRPESHRPTSDPPKQVIANRPLTVSPGPKSPALEIVAIDTDDEAPPPLPEKEKSRDSDLHADYANVGPSSSSRKTSESDDRPQQLMRRVTHRDRVKKELISLKARFARLSSLIFPAIVM